MADDDRLSNRLMARSAGLVRRQMPGGGEAFGGPLANKALNTVGARAMTMDSTVFVQDSFDANKGSDLALWAHEKHHLDESGGSDNHSEYDSEEAKARAHERFVLQQSKAGLDPDSILRGLDSANPSTAKEADAMFASMEQNGSEDDAGEPDPVEAYRNMLKDGMDHQQIVRSLAEHVVQTLERQEQEQDGRSAGESRL